MQQITVGHMYLHHLETGGLRPLSGLAELILNDGQFLSRQSLRHGAVTVEGHRAWSNGRPTSIRRLYRFSPDPGNGATALATGMGQLNTGDRPMFGEGGSDWLERLGMRIAPEAVILGTDSSFPADCSGLDHDQTSSTHGARAIMNQMPVVDQAIPAGILTHSYNFV